jgi:hypothetical protein
MTSSSALLCDGCGQLASPDHFARRLQWLEWTTRSRPVHVQALLLGAIAPESEASFLYSPEGRFTGEAGDLLDALQIPREGKSAEAVLTEFQKRGFLLTHVLECPLSSGQKSLSVEEFLARQLPAAIARIRRSLKPKRVVLISDELNLIAGKLRDVDLGCPVFASKTGSFLLKGNAGTDLATFRRALEGLAV